MADTKLTGLTPFTPVRTDLLYGVDDPSGTPVSGKLTISAVLGLASYNDLLDVPTTFPPSAHSHTLADISDSGTAAAADTGDFATATQGNTADTALQSVASDTTPQLGGALDAQGFAIGGFVGNVLTDVTGALDAATHSGKLLITSGNVTVPTTPGFTCQIEAGGAHTVTFNGTTTAAMAAGDVMSILVTSATHVRAGLLAVADQVEFT